MKRTSFAVLSLLFLPLGKNSPLAKPVLFSPLFLFVALQGRGSCLTLRSGLRPDVSVPLFRSFSFRLSRSLCLFVGFLYLRPLLPGL